MLSRQNRLAKDQDIKKVFAQGRSFFNPFLQIRYLKASPAARFAFVVSTKVSKQAAKRNRLKRLFRQLIRTKLKNLASGDYIFVLKPASATSEQKAAASAVELLTKAELLKESP